MTDNEKAERLLEVFADVPDDMLEKASPENKIRKKHPVWAFVAAAAAVVAVGGITTALLTSQNLHGIVSEPDIFTHSSAEPDSTPELPKINAEISFGDMGTEVYNYPDKCEYRSASPWKDTYVIEALPAYKFKVWYNDDRLNVPFDSFSSELAEQLKTAAASLGVEIDDSDIYNNGLTDEDIQSYLEGETADISEIVTDPSYVRADTEKFSIRTYCTYQTRVEFNSSSMPEENYYASTYEEALQTAERLKADYAGLLTAEGITDPVAVVDRGDFTFNGERICFGISFYDAGDTVGRGIENSAMKTVSFFGYGDRKLHGIVISRYDLCSEYLGDYPLLTVKEAAEELMSGNYSTNYYSAPISDDYRPTDYDKVVLEYRVDSHQEYILPYYRFFVDITDQLDNVTGRYYGAFYVPAVRPEYLE